MNKKKIILPNKRFVNAEEHDMNLKLDFSEESILLREGDKSIILKLDELYDKERQESINYKIFGKLNMVFLNSYSGTTNYNILSDELYPEGENGGYLQYKEFALIRSDIYREENKPSSSTTLGKFIPNTEVVGYSNHNNTYQTESYNKNWNLYLTYAYDSDSDYKMNYTTLNESGQTINYSFMAKDGIPFNVTVTDYDYVLEAPILHGMSVGEYIILSGDTLTGNTIDRCYTINEVGNTNYNSEYYVIKIKKSQFNDGIILPNLVMGKRCIDKRNINTTTSTYYVHLLKTLTGGNDYVLEGLGFESPIFRHKKKLVDNDRLVEKNRPESVLYEFTDIIQLSGITNNLGYTPTNLYVTTIFKNGNGYFNYPPKHGYKFNFHDTWIDKHFDGDASKEINIPTKNIITNNLTPITFIGGDFIPIGTEIIGDFIEYNEHEFMEKTITNAFHKIDNNPNIFNYGQTNSDITLSGATEDNPVGLFYQKHYKVDLRFMSPYVEKSKTDDIYNLPENTKYDKNLKVWKWRDLYDHGFIDSDNNGLNYPFFNGIHYIKNDINLFFRNETLYKNKSNGLINFKKTLC